MPTQTQAENLSAEVSGAAKTDKARARALTQARNDAKSLWDSLRLASEKGQDRSVQADLITAAKQRLALVSSALSVLS